MKITALCLAIALLSAGSIRAQDLALSEVPRGLPRETQRSLEEQRASIASRWSDFLQHKEEFNREFAGTEQGTDRAAAAARRKDELKREADAIVDAADQFNAAVLAAAGQPGKAVEAAEQEEFETRNEAWMKSQRELIGQRQEEENRFGSAILDSMKTPEQPPEPPPCKKYDELQPGDVLLINREGIAGYAIWAADTVSSATSSTASHTVLFLKEVNGKKLFLDNTSGLQVGEAAGVGPHIITGETFLRLYGRRGAAVAELANPDVHVAQPLPPDQAKKLWKAASALALKELADERGKAHNLVDKTDYGFWGGDMVCSDASRWALIRATGRNVPASRSPLKKLLNISFGPANFFGDRQDFIVTPLKMPGDDP